MLRKRWLWIRDVKRKHVWWSSTAKRTHTQTPNTHSQQSCAIRVFTSNVRGIVNNWDAIKQINLKQYDILLFNEIWQIREFEHLKLPEFVNANLVQRTVNRGGGQSSLSEIT